MTVRELILNPEFDLHCNFEIFDCSRSTLENAPLIFSTIKYGAKGHRISKRILNLDVRFITLDIWNLCLKIYV